MAWLTVTTRLNLIVFLTMSEVTFGPITFAFRRKRAHRTSITVYTLMIGWMAMIRGLICLLLCFVKYWNNPFSELKCQCVCFKQILIPSPHSLVLIIISIVGGGIYIIEYLPRDDKTVSLFFQNLICQYKKYFNLGEVETNQNLA